MLQNGGHHEPSLMESSRSELTKSLNTDDRFLTELKDAVKEEKEVKVKLNHTMTKGPFVKKLMDVLHDLPGQLHAAKAKKDEVKTKPVIAGFIAFISMVSVFGIMVVISACYCGNFVTPIPYNRFQNKDIVDLIVNENIKNQPSAAPAVKVDAPPAEGSGSSGSAQKKASGVVEIELGTLAPPKVNYE